MPPQATGYAWPAAAPQQAPVAPVAPAAAPLQPMAPAAPAAPAQQPDFASPLKPDEDLPF